MHANGASFFFIVVYIHMARGYIMGLFYIQDMLCECQVLYLIINGCYGFFRVCFTLGPNEFLRCYVITSLLASIPLIGNDFILLL